jgi:hypothetical protein
MGGEMSDYEPVWTVLSLGRLLLVSEGERAARGVVIAGGASGV